MVEKKNKKSDDATNILREAFRKLDLNDPKPKPIVTNRRDKKILKEEIIKHIQDDGSEFNLSDINPGDGRAWCDAFAMYCCGSSRKAIAKKFGIDEKTVGGWCSSQNWDDLKKKMIAKVQGQVADNLGEKMANQTTKMLDLLMPVVNELGQQAKTVVNSRGLDDKEIMKFFHDFAKLTGQFSGEFSENKNITIGSNDVYEKLMSMGNNPKVDTAGFKAELVEEPKLIE